MNNISSRRNFQDRLARPVKSFLNLIMTRNPIEVATKAYRLWKRSGFKGLWRKMNSLGHANIGYNRWIKWFDTLSESDRLAILDHISELRHKPYISIIMPTYNSSERWLRRAIESVRSQLYTHWELCIADDASSMPHVRSILNEYQNLDDRIKVVFRERNGHISAASNSALELALGEFIALLDHDDELSMHALYMVAVAINEDPNLDLIYSDEDKINEKNNRYDPYFKPDLNPDLLTSQNMICHLAVYRTELVRRIGGFREGYEGAQDWDLALRMTECIPSKRIKHLPYILYHWRAISGSTAMGHNEKSYASSAGKNALIDHFARIKKEAEVLPVVGNHYRVRYPIPSPAPLVSIIIPSRNGANLLKKCIDSILIKTHYSPFEIIVIDNQSDEEEALIYLELLENEKIARVIKYDAPFNYSAINNFAVLQSKGSLLCLMNNDIEVISKDWLNEMVAQALRPEIGAVGPMLYYPNDTIQHAGVILGLGGIAGHLYSGHARGTCGYMNRACLVQNLSAVTAACLVVRKDVFQEASCLDEINLPVAFNDIDFCLRLLEKGYRNLWTPFAELYHHESATRGFEDTPKKLLRFQQEISYMQARWGNLLKYDPAYNPNLTLDSGWPSLALAPRTNKPWQH
jgi:glycosyltransferase involved in cell wall biosynthesis